MSDHSIMSIKEMIDTAFGDPETNTINFKFIEAVLYILARQLRILERRVEVDICHNLPRTPSSSLSVTEVKIRASMPKKAKKSSRARTSDENLINSKPPIGSERGRAISVNSKERKTSYDRMKDIEYGSKKHKTSNEQQRSSSASTAAKSVDLTSTYPTTSSKTESEIKPKFDGTEDAAGKTIGSLEEGPGNKEKTKGHTDYGRLWDSIEEKREIELRVIEQRAESQVDPDISPIPMVSLDSMEMQQEKILIVERLPLEEAKPAATNRAQSVLKEIPRLSVVTQEQFDRLKEVVQQLQMRFGQAIGSANFPENAQLMLELRKGASLTDAMAALQLSARLEAAEKALENMMALVTDIAAATPDLDLTKKDTTKDTKLLFGASSAKSQLTTAGDKSYGSFKSADSQDSLMIPVLEQSKKHLEKDLSQGISKFSGLTMSKTKEKITYEQLESAMRELFDEVMQNLSNVTHRSTTNADTALNIAKRLESKLTSSLSFGNRMTDLELLVAEYTERINTLDTGLSSQMTNYQEQLTQMQHELETGLENMAEALANSGTDTTAITELHGNFTCLQSDLEYSMTRQNELQGYQEKMEIDLANLWRQIELLKAIKSDREEVEDALKDKAGIRDLNGLVSLQQFDAVRGDFEKRIGAAYDKFNNQEIIWQKAIDELVRELNEKADYDHVMELRDDINKHINKMKVRLEDMLAIVGEPRTAALTRQIHRDGTCISCSSPAYMNLEEPSLLPMLPAFGTPVESIKKTGEGGDGICYPGFPITHPRDPRAHICHRYCGGSHTLVTNTGLSRVPNNMNVLSLNPPLTTEVGIDGKAYYVEDTRKPCCQCNKKNKQSIIESKMESEPTQEQKQDKSFSIDSSGFNLDDMNTIGMMSSNLGDSSATPPVVREDY